MLRRFTLAVAAAFACAGLAVAEPPAPAVVVQVKPLARVLTDAREMIRQVGGPLMGEQLVKNVERDLKRTLGDKGFEGLDINRPLAVYAVLKDKPEDGVLGVMIPATGEKEFLAFLERLDLKPAAVEGKKGTYSLAIKPFPKASHLQFTDGGWAYLTLNDGEPTAATDLVPVGELLRDGGPELVRAKVYPGRVPAKVLSNLLDLLDQGAGEIRGELARERDPGAKFATTFLEQAPKLVRRYTESALKEVEEVALAVNFDAAGGDVVAELTIAAKAGTPTAKQFAAIGPTSNRFAGALGKDAVLGVTLNSPLFAAEGREITVAGIELAQAALQQSKAPGRLKPILDEAVKGFQRAVKAGKHDAAIGVVGPGRDGKFVLLAAQSIDGPTAVEKAMRDAAKDTSLSREFAFNVAKIGDVGIHKVPVARLFSERDQRELHKMFGDGLPGHVAFAKDAAYFAFGTNSLDAIKAAVAAKPGPAPAIDVVWNAGRLHKMVATVEPRAAEELAKVYGVDDKGRSALRLTVASGERLKLTGSFNVQFLPKWFLMGVSGAAAPPPPVAVPAKR